MKKIVILLTFAASLSLLSACKDTDPKDCALAECSDQFNTIYMQVVDTLKHPVALDTFMLVNMSDKSAIPPSFAAADFKTMQETGKYLMLDDNYVSKHQNTQLVIEFIAILDKEEVAKQAVTIEVDCCHISPYYGSLYIVLPIGEEEEVLESDNIKQR